MSTADLLNRAHKARLARFAARAVPQAEAPILRGSPARAREVVDHAYERAWAAAILGAVPADGRARRRPRIEDIQRATAQHFGLTAEQLSSGDRAAVVARPRHVAMFLARQLTRSSAAEIGRRFGGRDHATVVHAARRIEELLARDAGLAASVDRIRAALNDL
jgi:chromosomal replication initiation ATPase DnaA